MIMLCAGTGIAPFRGVAQERAVLMTQGKNVGPALLYVEMDRLYVNELENWIHMGAVDERWACSRPEKWTAGKYVQDQL